MTVGNQNMGSHGDTAARKFEWDGSPRSFRGNTIICPVPSSNAAHRILIELQAALRKLSCASSFTFLPETSFHMTLLRGVNNQIRTAGEWPSDIPLDMPIEHVHSLFRQRLAGTVFPERFRMKPVELGTAVGGESQLYLEPVDADEAELIAGVRRSIHKKLNHERPLDESYRFHITFSYRIRKLDEDQEAELGRMNRVLFNRFIAELGVFEVGMPVLCRYDDMTAFVPITEEG